MPLGMVLQSVQKQQLNARLVQQMKLLQMNGQELEAYIAKAVEENPVLEFPEPLEGWQEMGPSFRGDKVRNFSPDDDLPGNPIENIHRKVETLEEVLEEQINCLHLSEQEKRMAYYIVATLDNGGYWKNDLKETSELFGLSIEDGRRLLSLIQHMEPVGIAASSLEECLLLQLEPETEENQLARKIIREGLELLASNRIPALASSFHVTNQEILRAREIIRTLQPKPGAPYAQQNPTVLLREDAFVKVGEKGLTLTVYNPWGGRLVLNQDYLNIEKETDNEKIRQYLKEQIQKARTLQHMVKGRYDTLRLVFWALVTHQEAFFREGPGHKAPLKLADLAEDTGFTVSTVSRALQNKVIACRWGSYRAGDFLVGTTAGPSGNRDSAITEERLKTLIRHIIDGEDKVHPLSDQAICNALNAQGVKVSRRTVNKYRINMHIPDKAERREWK
jgi:RNA polymerase sigma-54 factor